MSQIKVVELFSGIGSQARAFQNIGVNFQTAGTCEWDIRATVAYDFIHNNIELDPRAKCLNKTELLIILSKYELSGDCKNPMAYAVLKTLKVDILRQVYSSILRTNNFVNIKELKGEQLPCDIDVMTYSFPCQDLSNVGAFHGYTKGIDKDANNRSGLLWEVERILKERNEQKLGLPKILILENVTALNNNRHKSNFEIWQCQLQELGYYNKVYALNSRDFGSAQNRHRLIMVSVLTNGNENLDAWLDAYLAERNLENAEYRKTLKIKKQLAKDVLKLDMANPVYFAEAQLSQPNNTESRKKIWENNLQIVDAEGNIKPNTATITTKQDRHPNSGNIYFDYTGNAKSKFRYLTPRECFCLMGFKEKDFERIMNNNIDGRKGSTFFTRDILLRLAGNSIVVQILEHVFRQVVDILEYMEEVSN